MITNCDPLFVLDKLLRHVPITLHNYTPTYSIVQTGAKRLQHLILYIKSLFTILLIQHPNLIKLQQFLDYLHNTKYPQLLQVKK